MSGMTFVNPNILALKYGKDMEMETVNTFVEYIWNYPQDCIISGCGLVLDKTMPYIGASSDRLMSCSCIGMACIEIKHLYLINYTEPNKKNFGYLYKDGNTVKFKQNHKYFTQCLKQMGVTKTTNSDFVLWNTFGLHMEWW